MSKISEEYLTSAFKKSVAVPKEFDQAKAWELFMELYKKETDDVGIDVRNSTVKSLVEKVLTIMTHYNNRLTKEFTDESH